MTHQIKSPAVEEQQGQRLKKESFQSMQLNNSTTSNTNGGRFPFADAKNLGFYDELEKTAPSKHLSLNCMVELIRSPCSQVNKKDLPLITPYDGNAKTKEAAATAKYWASIVDVDGVAEDIHTAANRIRQMGYTGALLSFTTSSHGKDGKHHYKLIIPFGHGADVATAHALSNGLCLLLGADAAQSRIQQGFFAPNSHTLELPYEGIIDGLDNGYLTPDCQLYIEAMARFEQEEAKKLAKATAASLKPKPKAPALANSSGNIISLINAAYPLEGLLNNYGHKLQGKAWLSPNSNSGSAGGHILDGGRFYSHHGSCILGADNNDGHSLDAADVLCLYQYGGDYSAMVKDQASKLDPEGEKQRRRDYMAEQERLNQTVTISEQDAKAAETTVTAGLPPLPKELANLPSGLGAIQQYIHGTMAYPCMYTAGWGAISTISALAQTHITINSQRGLGLNEYWTALAHTGFGKEAMRDVLVDFVGLLKKKGARHNTRHTPIIEFSAPASKQGLHMLLENAPNHSVMLQADEFAEWLKSANRDANKYQALSYLMEAYTKAMRDIHPGRAVTGDYQTIQKPRLSVFATTTPSSFLSSINQQIAEAGAYNRMIVYLAPDKKPQKKYTGFCFNVPQQAYEVAEWIVGLEPTHMNMSDCAFRAYVKNDSQTAEPIKEADADLGARLSEQAIKMAALFALADKRVQITGADMDLAYKIRLGLYYRAKAAIDESGAISGNHESGKALEQLTGLFKTNKALYISQFDKRSRAFKGLSVAEQKAVIDALLSRGIAARVDGRPKIMKSMVYGEP